MVRNNKRVFGWRWRYVRRGSKEREMRRGERRSVEMGARLMERTKWARRDVGGRYEMCVKSVKVR